GLWLNPRIDVATSTNDFDLRQLRQRPMSIYLGVTPDNLDRMAPLLNLFFQQVVDLNTRELPEQNSKLNRKVLLLLDEFPALGNVNVLAKSVAFIAGYGIRLLTVVQSPAQLRCDLRNRCRTQFHDQPRRRGRFCAEGTGCGQ
ncbi:type IV secretory system conjugative DNA transfer family protein, partial [Bradyrhizobium sp. SSUT112]|uniref:type IV secretory system conjugative DNA transfer family protein n=1 Tax=Bradyrhizobium sp. SSUT112 TaxID=3040604 RepID=UPI0024473224